MVNLDTLADGVAAVAPRLSDTELAAWLDALTPALTANGIADTLEIAAFLGQVAEETGGFQVFEENLHYSAARLCVVWPSRFPSLAAAAPYAMQPEKLANNVYASRGGNGNAASGDGWRFRGQGLIQLTFRNNFADFGKSIGKTAEEAAAYVATREGAAASAAWFWHRAKLNSLADGWQITAITRVVNGGLTNLAQRVQDSDTARDAMQA